MDRSLVLKANALAKGTRRIDLSILTDAAEPAPADDDIMDAEFVDVPAPAVETQLATLNPVLLPQVTPGRARRATDAYAPASDDRRPIIAIG